MASSDTLKLNCTVCCNSFSISKLIECPRCNYIACVICVQKYILTQITEMHCMNCKMSWNIDFYEKKLTKKFLNIDYKNYKKECLLSRELSLLPETQTKLFEKKEKQRKIDEIHKQIEELRCQLMLIQSNVNISEKTKFERPCPINNCRGFLSSRWKCGLCDSNICCDCREIKLDGHICDKNTIETIKLMESDSRPCPKCKSLIYRISGCFAKDTPILLWNGGIKMSQDITIGDVLVGDDGKKRNVINTVNGIDEMYEVCYENNSKYIVNSLHLLVLKYQYDKKIHYSASINRYVAKWFDHDTKKIHSKKFEKEADAQKFVKELKFPDIFKIQVKDYLNLPGSVKSKLMGFKLNDEIKYEDREITLDPYLLGVWLGDGTHSNATIASNDIEVQKYLLDWCNQNDAELIHDRDVLFRIRRKGNSNGKNDLRKPIGNSSCDTCKGCETKRMEICNFKSEEEEKEHKRYACGVNGCLLDYASASNLSVHRTKHHKKEEYPRKIQEHKTNPFLEQLKKYNLLKNKHIPIDYMMNNRDVRLKMLAGWIDTDGTCPKDQKGKRAKISQTRPEISEQIILLAKSLGFNVNYSIIQRNHVKKIDITKTKPIEYVDYKPYYEIFISGLHLSDIPTQIERKKCNNAEYNKDYYRYHIRVNPIGKDKYYGWTIDENNLFILKDFTVVSNCPTMFCTFCNTPWNWDTGKIILNERYIHNVHYFEWLAKNGLKQNKNRDQDQNCPPDAHDIYILQDVDEVFFDYYRFIGEIDRMRRDIRNNDNEDLRISYIENKITKEKFSRTLYMRKKNYEKQIAFSQIYEVFINASNDIFNRFILDFKNNKRKILLSDNSKKDFLLSFNNQTRECINFVNDRLLNLYKRFNSSNIFTISYKFSFLNVKTNELVDCQRVKSYIF